MKETFELYKSGKPRTIRLKAWGLVSTRGVLATNMHGTPLITALRKNSIAWRLGEKIVKLEVTIKAAPKKAG